MPTLEQQVCFFGEEISMQLFHYFRFLVELYPLVFGNVSARERNPLRSRWWEPVTSRGKLFHVGLAFLLGIVGCCERIRFDHSVRLLGKNCSPIFWEWKLICFLIRLFLLLILSVIFVSLHQICRNMRKLDSLPTFNIKIICCAYTDRVLAKWNLNGPLIAGWRIFFYHLC